MDGKEIEMPSEFDDMTGKGALMCQDTPLEGRKNAAYMKAVLEAWDLGDMKMSGGISTMFPPNLHLTQIIRYNGGKKVMGRIIDNFIGTVKNGLAFRGRTDRRRLLGVYPYIPGDPWLFCCGLRKRFLLWMLCKTILRSDDPADTGSDRQKAA